jgi:hypothetical protein
MPRIPGLGVGRDPSGIPDPFELLRQGAPFVPGTSRRHDPLGGWGGTSPWPGRLGSPEGMINVGPVGGFGLPRYGPYDTFGRYGRGFNPPGTGRLDPPGALGMSVRASDPAGMSGLSGFRVRRATGAEDFMGGALGGPSTRRWGVRYGADDPLARYRFQSSLPRYRFEARGLGGRPLLSDRPGGGLPKPPPVVAPQRAPHSDAKPEAPGWLRWEYAAGVLALAALAGLLHALFSRKGSPG